ncbi:MAG: polyprenyl synthetase family protein [Bacteroidaceae bacterium]|jgi:geranylgeranyl diphosphate synthase type II|nr:polyprenyl synthetase family protein [Bacteroidaceae bacterium]
MYSSEEILAMINQGLDDLQLDRQPLGLYKPIRYVLGMGGKRVRPVLMLLVYNLYKDDLQKVLPVALGVETYHNYTLLHDDVMDRADVRRGHPCVHKVWNENTAILSGDSMLVMAYQLVAQCQSEHLKEVLDLFTQTALEIGEGQQYDVDFEQRMDVRPEEYVEMIRLKTSVLLACAMKLGAIMAGVPEKDAELMYGIGESVGLAFQLQDDMLDVYGDYETFGKRIGGDILCNKKTYMLIKALEGANAEQRAELERWLMATDYNEEEKIAAVKALYDSIGVREICQSLINDYFKKAQTLLDEVSLSVEKKQILWQYILTLLGRKS